MKNLSQLSDADKDNLAKGNYDALSNEALDIIDQAGSRMETYAPKDGLNYLLSKIGIDPDSMPAHFVKSFTPPPVALANLGSNVAQNIAATPTHPFNAMNAALSSDQTNVGMGIRGAAQVGQFANQGNQQLADLMKQYGGGPGRLAGAAYGATSNALVPHDPMGVVTAPLMAMGAEGAVNSGIEQGSKAALKTGAQILKAPTGLLEDAGKQFLEDPLKILMAPATKQAGENIANAASKNNLKAGMDGFAEVFGSEFAPTPSELLGNIKTDWPTSDKLSQLLTDGKISPQEALSNIQAINHVKMLSKYKNPLNDQEMSILLNRKSQLVDFLNDKGMGEVTDALENYRYSKIRDSLMSLLPTNARGDVSRFFTGTMLGAGAASEGISRARTGQSNPLATAASMAAFSPIMLGPAMGGTSLLMQALARGGALPAKLAAMRGMENIAGANQ